MSTFLYPKKHLHCRLAQFKNEKVVSRAQAKRVLAGVGQFKTVVIDFDGVELVGTPFVDEMFRVFPRSHPDIEMLAVNENPAIHQLIEGAKSRKDSST
jgi:STAS-like domain of unknown function (DUF4325)